ncbi:MAG: hypothetical protein QOF52_1222 [Propionibacteriaceae bacterium]|jgi:hypothetical protein|nr:hypothetical protein [Propionibacteriaceae bacterium]MDX6321364.1 hypothetical protein [Propionibacteriaceae bacterium]
MYLRSVTIGVLVTAALEGGLPGRADGWVYPDQGNGFAAGLVAGIVALGLIIGLMILLNRNPKRRR